VVHRLSRPWVDHVPITPRAGRERSPPHRGYRQPRLVRALLTKGLGLRLAIFKWFYLVFAAWFVASGVLNLLSAFFIRARRYRTFSFIVSGINCLHTPLGTALGVFTIIVLIRDSVRELYEG